MSGFASLCFLCALIHILFASHFASPTATKQGIGIGTTLCSLFFQVDWIFTLWACLFLIGSTLQQGLSTTWHELTTQDFKEPFFIFAILIVAWTQPLLTLSNSLLLRCSQALPGSGASSSLARYCICLTIGPLLGSVMTEPVAMTLTALLLKKHFYSKNMTQTFKYATLGLLWVNVSIGGVLTPYAAPPILLVAHPWNWNLSFLMTHFGWKAIIAIILSTAWVAFHFRKELIALPFEHSQNPQHEQTIPFWISTIHLIMLGLCVRYSHQPPHLFILLSLFILFTRFTAKYQNKLQFYEGCVMGCFLFSLIILGKHQRWWLEPLLKRLDHLPLFLGTIGLTGFTDNAALTYLGTQIPDLPEYSRYLLVAGAVTGGGLTLIANAPNLIGHDILKSSFDAGSMRPISLFLHALIPTIIAGICFWSL
jgi:predicted cation transporter